MSQTTPTTPSFAKRAVQLAALTIGGGVALTFAMAGSASADEVVVQDAEVTNAGVGVANSGGNVAVGNASQNTAAAGQAAVGGIASNQATTSNSSDGTAVLATGDATATGNQSGTSVAQHATGDADPGLAVAVQDADVTNVGVGIANSGLNGAVGNASQNTALTGQLAVGIVAVNAAETGNTSDGTALLATGDATATGNASSTKLAQGADVADGAGLAVVVQDADVANVGFGLANSGGNLVAGNLSSNLAVNVQGAFGVLASNSASTKNGSNGTAGLSTGNATATGNSSDTEVGQSASVDPDGIAVVVQSAPVLNAGIGVANSGGNAVLANGSANADVLVQVAFGLLASNASHLDSWSDGFAFLATGDAVGTGNQATTKVEQTA